VVGGNDFEVAPDGRWVAASFVGGLDQSSPPSEATIVSIAGKTCITVPIDKLSLPPEEWNGAVDPAISSLVARHHCAG